MLQRYLARGSKTTAVVKVVPIRYGYITVTFIVILKLE
jgi:hypothetical protein